MKTLSFLDGDVMRSTINRVSAINFSQRVHQILVKDMVTTVVFHLMDVENRYFLVKFHSREAYEKVLTQGLWIVLGQYLKLQPWTLKFNPFQAYPNNTLVWMDKGSSGKFARMVVYIDLEKFGYLQNLFPSVGSATNIVVGLDLMVGTSSINDKVAKPTEAFGPWMLVE
ncbi:hypothetical protein Godav_013484 [Gossypium davidsonii]|uniref:DUF4283 domain-containing protein n=1 Tax=Gossypium davidsonii TaxID=34287 RepID=A0A7J8RHA7_GOSDV|nr:hypothetical protein [Gossypium davidsonii]